MYVCMVVVAPQAAEEQYYAQAPAAAERKYAPNQGSTEQVAVYRHAL